MLTAVDIEGKRLTSINDLLGDVSNIPLDFAESVSAVLDKIFLTDWFFQSVENGIRGGGLVILDEEIAFSVPGLDSLQIVIGGGGGVSVFPVQAQVGEASQGISFSILLNEVLVGLRVSAEVLRPLKPGTREPDPDATSLMITLGAIDLEFSSAAGLTLRQGSTPAQVPPCAIGNTGILLEIGKLRWLTPHTAEVPANTPAEFTGVFLDDVIAEVPQFSAAVRMDDVFIGTGGFSGIISRPGLELGWDGNDFTGDLRGELLGFKGGISGMSIEFRQNALVGCEMKGDIFIPYFNKRVGLTLGIDGAGGLSATAALPTSLPPETGVTPGSPGYLIHLDVADFLSLDVASVRFKAPAGDLPRLGIAGRVAPGAGALSFPPMEITGLWIDSNGHIQTEGDGIQLPNRYTIDFKGAKLEITKVGFGNTEEGGKWIGFTGGVKLVAGMPAGASVEGLRITKHQNGTIGVTLKGVRVEFEVPNTLKFAGEVSYDDNAKQFRGAVKLDLIALKMQIDATAVFGTKDGQTYLALYLAAEFPAGIPLFATGLGVYGMAGLFAMNMEPNRRADQPWYALGSNTDWYHEGDPDGVTNLAKWKSVNGSMGFGAGVTLGTLADNGHTFSGKMLLAIVFPGPILLMQGSASLLQERTALDKDANFSALAVLDGRAGILQLGLDAQYRYDKTNGSLLDIRGAAEGFFNFNDPNAWRLNIGMNEPRERRLSARLFKLFDANAYVMLNPQQLAMGAWVGFKQQWQFGPLTVGLEAWIDGNARVSWKPAHFYGDLSLHGSARLSVFGFSAGLTVGARLAADVFDPLHILGNFRVGIDLPWPFSDISVNVKLEWGPQLTPPPIPLALKEVAVEHFKTTTSWPLSRVSRGEIRPLLVPNYDRNGDGFFVDTSASPLPERMDQIPVVPLDSRPHITFARNINDDALVGVNAQPVVPEFERIGDPLRNQGPARVRYGLEEIILEKMQKSGSETTWKRVARKGTTPNGPDVSTLFGSWAPMPQMPGGGGRNAGQTKLWLWSRTPFEYTRHSGRAWDEWFSDEYTDYPCQTLPGSGWNFEEIAPSDDLGQEWRHPDEPNLAFDGHIMSIKELSRPSHGMTHAFGITGRGRSTIMLPQPTNLVRIMIPDGRYVRFQDFIGRDKDRKGFAAVLGGTEERPYIQISGIDIVSVHYFPEVYKRFPVLKGLGAAIGCSYIPSLNKLIFVEFHGKLSEFDVTSNEYRILGTGYANPEDVVVTADGDVAYITERSGTLLRVDLTSNADRENAVVISEGMNAPQQIALDEEGGQAYVVEYDSFKRSGRLLRIALSGPMRGNQIVVAEGLDQAVGLLVTNDLTTAYVSEQADGGRLTRIDLATGNKETIVTELPSIFMLRWANAAQDTILATQRDPENLLIKIYLNKPEEEPEQLLTHLPTLPSSAAILPDDRYIVCCDDVLTMFSTTLLIPMIVDVDGNVLVRHFEDEFVRWTQAGEVLEPHTTYRLQVKTTMKERGDGKLRGYTRDATATEYAYFRTDGPPGVARLTAPIGSDANAGSFVSPLDDLSRYVRRTMPALAPPTPAAPVPSRLFYRAYDVGMEFDENYVDLMYRIGRRDLSIHLHDSNGAIRDHLGRRLVLANQWGKAETVTLTDREERWLSVMGTAGCELIPIGSIVKNSTFNAASAPHLLPPSALCEARLVPALLHDAFGGYKITVANGPGGKLERWQVRDDAGSPNSRWQIEGSDDLEVGQVANGAASAIVYTNASELAADHREQPSNWTDYRLTVHMRFSNGRLGLLWRYRDGGDHYRFIMEQGQCQLVRILAGAPTVLATKGGFTIPSQPFAVTVEAIGSSFSVYIGEERLLSATDTAINTGSVGVYSSGSVTTKFTDIYVDDFRNSAPVVYRFSFLSSRFKNFVDHLGSFDDKISLSELDETANVATLIAAAATTDNPPLEAESRAYDSLVAQLPGVVSSAPVVRVTRVQQNGNAIAFLVQSPEPLDWKRVHVNLLRAQIGDDDYAEVTSKVLRKADGAGVVVAPVSGSPGSLLPPGDYRLVFTYRRDNRVKDDKSEVLSEAGDTSPEEATLDLPWQLEPEQSADELVEMLELT